MRKMEKWVPSTPRELSCPSRCVDSVCVYGINIFLGKCYIQRCFFFPLSLNGMSMSH